MIAINHALTGAVIGLAVQRPIIAVPAAFISHFVCDALPHYGSKNSDEAHLRSKRFIVQLIIDAALCFGLVLVLFLAAPQAWLLAAICAFVAASPDFAWLPGYLRIKRGERISTRRSNWFTRFAADIQWFQRPIGAVVEVAWAGAAIAMLLAYL